MQVPPEASPAGPSICQPDHKADPKGLPNRKITRKAEKQERRISFPTPLYELSIMEPTYTYGLETLPRPLVERLLSFRSDPKNQSTIVADWYVNLVPSTARDNSDLQRLAFAMSLSALRSSIWNRVRHSNDRNTRSWTDADSHEAAKITLHVDWCAFTSHLPSVRREWATLSTDIDENNYHWMLLAMWVQKGWHRLVYGLSEETRQVLARTVWDKTMSADAQDGNIVDFLNPGFVGLVDEEGKRSDLRSDAARADNLFAEACARIAPLSLSAAVLHLHQYGHGGGNLSASVNANANATVSTDVTRPRTESHVDMHRLWDERRIIPGPKTPTPLETAGDLPYMDGNDVDIMDAFVRSTEPEQKRQDSVAVGGSEQATHPDTLPDAQEHTGCEPSEMKGTFKEGANSSEATIMQEIPCQYPSSTK